MCSFLLQVDREFRILSALHSVSFPVPKPYLYCEDVSIIGTEFYVMEHVKVGIVPLNLPTGSCYESWGGESLTLNMCIRHIIISFAFLSEFSVNLRHLAFPWL